MANILIADDHPLFRKALAQALGDLLPDVHYAEVETIQGVRTHLEDHSEVDLILLDLHMPDSHGLMGLAAIRAEYPAVAVVMISAHDDPATIRRALDYGASGFIPKSADLVEFKNAITAVLNCEEWVPHALRNSVANAKTSPSDKELSARLATLTPQQFRVLALVAQGKLNKQIADVLGVQERTVKAHLSAIFDRLGVSNRTQAGIMLRTLELADPSRVVLSET
jgi:DNA-binding NarL/FixJ family response regulator